MSAFLLNAVVAIGLVAGLTAVVVTAQPVGITLPPDTSTLRASDLPGYRVAQQKCGVCHSADYVSYQPPGMTQAQWTAEMTKMRQAYGAPLDDDDVKILGAYLAAAYGSATASAPSVLESPGLAATPAAPPPVGAVDVQAVLAASGCLVCHAVDRKLIGPSFHDIALKYERVADAASLLAGSIRKGSVGKWGQIPMPAMAGVNDTQARALSEFVLKQ